MAAKKHLWIILIIGLVCLLAIVALNEDLLVREYEIETNRVESNVRLAVIADLHQTRYGEPEEEQDAFIQILRDHRPDAVCLVGDLLDGGADEEPAWELMERLNMEFDCYYVTGNHEFWSGRAEEYIARIEDIGIPVLRGEGVIDLARSGMTRIGIFGVDDPDGLSGEAWQMQLDECRRQREAAKDFPDDIYSILLTHRPERVDAYEGFDLVLAGHAHGGQVRIPGLMNGLFAPNQGLFPQYAGGKYVVSGGRMIVSRGLARNKLPRIFNRPEVVIVNILPPEGVKEKRIS